MNQVNLMNLLYAVPEVTAAQLPGGQQPTQAGGSGMEFLLNLQQEIWAAQMPKVGVSLLTTLGQSDAGENGFFAGFPGSLQAEGLPQVHLPEATQPITGIGVASEGNPRSPVSLLDTLTASLKQAFELLSKSIQPNSNQNGVNAGENGAIPSSLAGNQTQVLHPAKLAFTEPSSEVLSNTGQTSVALGKDVLLQSPELRLADTWQIAAGILKSELQLQGVMVNVSAPELRVAQSPIGAGPWVLVSSETLVQPSKVWETSMPRAATLVPEVAGGSATQNAAVPTDTPVPSDAPASIRWFAQPATSGQQAAQPTTLAPQAMATEIDLGNETKLKVSITPAAQPTAGMAAAKGEPVVLNISLALAGETNVALDAKLTLLPVVHKPMLPQLPVANVAVPPLETSTVPVGKVVGEKQAGLPIQGGHARQNEPGNLRLSIPEQPAQMNPAARPIGIQLDNNGMSRMAMPLQTGLAQAEPLAAAKPSRPGAVPIQAGFTQREVATNQQAQQASVSRQVALASTGEPVTKAVPIVIPKPGKTTGLIEAKVADENSAQENSPKHKAAIVAANEAAQTRKAAFAALGQKQTSRLQTLSQLNSGSTGTPASELQPGLTPLVGVVSQEVPAQLLQFSCTATAFRAPGVLNYLELANRLMEKVATARLAGNGVHSAKLTLNPANLGQMSVNIAVQGESVALQITLAAGVPKALLKESLDALQLSLEESGLTVLEFRVEELGSEQERSQNQQQTADTQSANQNQVAGTVEPVEVFQIDPALFGTAVPA